jgi:PAS domain S-box-containing protein
MEDENHTQGMVHILHLEDNKLDAELIRSRLEEAGIHCRMKVVECREDFESSLEAGGYDLIFSDFTLPSYDGEAALQLCLRKCPDVPFIYISSTIGEESAVKAVLKGATDYILKSNLSRLPAAVIRALRESEAQREEKRLQEALHRSEAKYRRIVETTQEGIWAIDARGRTEFVNARLSTMLGYTLEEMLGHKPVEFVFPEDISEAETELERQLQGFRNVMEARFRRKDGAEVWSTLATTPIMEGGRFQGGLATLIDITDRKKLESQFLQSQKMETIGHLAGGIAHDFNNIVQVILAYAQFIEKNAEVGSTTAKDVEKIITAAQRASDLSHQLLTFSRRTQMAMGDFDIRPLIKELAIMLERTFPSSFEINFGLEENLPTIWADPTQVYQVLMNLCVNARDAMPNGGKLKIAAQRETVREGDRPTVMGAPPGKYVVVSVADTGTGIAPEHIDRIFEPFFTTKEVGKGTGLGLSACYGIMRQHEGCLLCDSIVGKGTTIRAYFPQSTLGPARVEIVSAKLKTSSVGQETILVADDQADIRFFIERSLSKWGYSVITATDGKEAIDLFVAHGGNIDLVLLDLQMPRLDGLACAETILAKSVGKKILLMTGFADEDIRNRVASMGVVGIVQKPITHDQLAIIVRQTLDENFTIGKSLC